MLIKTSRPMNHEKIFVREDGTKVKIRVSIYVDTLRYEYRYDTMVSICAPKKRTWIVISSVNDYQWRRLNQYEREEYSLQEKLKIVTKEEIQEVALELWGKIKPTFL